MTKYVRIENADTSTYKVQVLVQDKDPDGAWVTVDVVELCNPADLVALCIYKGRRLIVEEFD